MGKLADDGSDVVFIGELKTLLIYIYKSNRRTHCDNTVGPYPGSLLHFHLGKLQLPREGGTGK